MAMPFAFRFKPRHHECVLFLACKVTGTPLPSCTENSILHLDPYDVKQLPDIFMSTEARGGHLFFFTKLTKKGKSGSNNANRTVGKGTWHGDQTNDVERRGGKIGKYSKLKYLEKGSKYDQRFIMTEYTLPKDSTKIPYDPLKDYVLCHLKRNDRCKNVKEVSQSISNSLNNEIADVPAVDQPTDSQVDQALHHIAAPELMQLPPDHQTFVAPIYDQQQPLAMEEVTDVHALPIRMHSSGNGCFENHSSSSNPDQTGGYPLLSAPVAAPTIQHQNYPYQYSWEVASQVVPHHAPAPASVVENGLPPPPLTLDCSSFDYEMVPNYVEPLAIEPPSQPYDETPLDPFSLHTHPPIDCDNSWFNDPSCNQEGGGQPQYDPNPAAVGAAIPDQYSSAAESQEPLQTPRDNFLEYFTSMDNDTQIPLDDNNFELINNEIADVPVHSPRNNDTDQDGDNLHNLLMSKFY